MNMKNLEKYLSRKKRLNTLWWYGRMGDAPYIMAIAKIGRKYLREKVVEESANVRI